MGGVDYEDGGQTVYFCSGQQTQPAAPSEPEKRPQ